MKPSLLNRDWRLESLYYVVDKNSRKIRFNPNSVQRRINANQSKRKIILKARQMGVSTNELIKQLDFVLFNKNVTACILAHEQDGIEKLFRIPRRAYEFLPDALEKVPLDKGGGSKYEMYFPKLNSRIFCDLESRGNTINWLHVSEMAFIKERDRVLATLESVPLDGIITFESTANGMNHFYDDWMDRDSNYEKLFYPWYLHDEYFIKNHGLTQKDLTKDEKKFIDKAKSLFQVDITLDQIAFRRFKQRELKKLYIQEYPEDDATCFLTSGGNPFTLEIIKNLYDNAPKPLKVVDGVRFYKEKEKNRIYVLGADTAEGVGGDRSAVHVFDANSREQVAVWHGNLKPGEFAEKIVEIAEIYKVKFTNQVEEWPLIAPERNNHGHAVLLKLDEVLNYPNIYMMKSQTKADTPKLGWVTDKVTRPIMINAFIEGVENGTIIINDRETLGECLTLVNNDGKIEAEDGKTDDLFISACISVQLCIEQPDLSLYHNVSSLIKI
jgi:hypothetical protein